LSNSQGSSKVTKVWITSSTAFEETTDFSPTEYSFTDFQSISSPKKISISNSADFSYTAEITPELTSNSTTGHQTESINSTPVLFQYSNSKAISFTDIRESLTSLTVNEDEDTLSGSEVGETAITSSAADSLVSTEFTTEITVNDISVSTEQTVQD
jgi:hypothetical protein